MKFFCTDLDNTIIHSYRHDVGREKVLVEKMNGKELSFMSVRSYDLLKQAALSKMIVPVTTRSLHQYLRIDFGKDVPIRYALVANGGILLENGEINQNWYKETKHLIKEAEQALKQSLELLAKDPDVYFEIRKVDELFVYTKSGDSAASVERLKKKLDQEVVYIDRNGEKVYVFPRILNKGESLQRFRHYIGKENLFIAAGDSAFDIPMLLAADVGLCPNELSFERSALIISFDKRNFTENLLEYVMNY